MDVEALRLRVRERLAVMAWVCFSCGSENNAGCTLADFGRPLQDIVHVI
jgi:hypothetical protein